MRRRERKGNVYKMRRRERIVMTKMRRRERKGNVYKMRRRERI